MVLESPPTNVRVLNNNGKISRPWNDWLTKLAVVLNNTETTTVVTGVSPTITSDITYIKGD